MKTQIVRRTLLTMFGFTLLVFFILPIVPALGTTEFEIGTRFGISHLVPDVDDDSISTSITYANMLSAPAYIGSSPTALYATWFPSKQFAIGPEFSFGRMSVSAEYWGEPETESITTLYLGGRAAYFLQSHAVSNPYVLGRVSTTILSGEDAFFFDGNQMLTSFGIGLGYQWRIDSAFALRVEGQYQRLLMQDEEDNANEFSFILGIGTRFGNSKSNTSEVPSTQ